MKQPYTSIENYNIESRNIAHGSSGLTIKLIMLCIAQTLCTEVNMIDMSVIGYELNQIIMGE